MARGLTLLTFLFLVSCEARVGAWDVVAVSPPDGALDVALDAELVVATTPGTQLDPVAIRTDGLSLFDPQTGTAVAGDPVVARGQVTWAPRSPLRRATTYRATVSEFLRATDGTVLGSPFEWSFTTHLNLGEIDRDFGNGGTQVVSPSEEWSRGHDVARLADDHLVVVGEGSRADALYGLLVGFTADGQPDDSFGDGGVVWVGNPYTNLWLRAVTIDAEGRIVAVGTVSFLTAYSGVVVRLLPDGAADPTFGNGGVLTHSCDVMGEGIGFVDVVTRPDGTILAVGNHAGPSWCRGFVVALDDTGEPAPGFGGCGVVEVELDAESCIVGAATLDDDDIVLAASTFVDGEDGPLQDVSITRLTAQGAHQPGFGDGGTTVVPCEEAVVQATDVLVDDRGGIVASGYASASPGEAPRGFVLRLDADGQLDETFGGGGVVAFEGDTITGMVPQADGKIVVVGERGHEGDLLDRDGFVARLRPDGSLDSAFGVDGSVVHGDDGQGEQLTAVTVQSTHRLVAVGSSVDEQSSLYLLGLE